VSEPTTGLDLETIGAGLLADVQAYFAANNVDLPDRHYLAPGAPGLIAWDCEQLVVSLASVSWGINEDALQPVPQIGDGAGTFEVRHAQWSVQLVRCTPVSDEGGQPPPAVDIQTAGELSLLDAGMLSQCLVNFATFPANHTWLPAGALAKAGGVVTLGPSGGFSGHEGTFTVTVTELASPNPAP
jgi:hypothetical protein